MRNKLTVPVSLLLAMVVAVPLLGQLPAGWTSRDIGSPAGAGNAQYDAATQTWTIRGDGTGIRGQADQFQFVHKTLVGDGELVARVVSLDPPRADWSMAGVMIRVMLTPGSPYIFMGVSANTDTKNHGITFWGREAFDGVAETESTGATGAPLWVKVTRTGNTFAGFSSSDGKEWTQRYSATAAGIPNSIYIGYAVSSEVGGKLVTAVFDMGPVIASNPDPADGERYIRMPLLAWTPGITATAHDVYFGTSPDLDQADYQGRQSLEPAWYYHRPDVIPGMTYYWRIDEVGADGKTIHQGDVWSFTVAPVTAYSPQPWNGLDGVDANADLAWISGIGAISHDIYFGTDRAAVKAGDLGTFKGNQSALTFDPGVLAANTAYYWRIAEHDLAGAVHPGPVWDFTTVGPGLGVRAQYFRGTELAGDPMVTRTEDSIDHDWGSGEVAGGLSDGVSARWTTDLEAPLTETYQLITTSDDGVRLWLDGRRIIDNWTTHGSTDDVATVNLIAGQFYHLRMEWFDNSGGAVARLSWQSPSIPLQPIPAGILQLPGRATDPYPANPSVNVLQTPILHWSASEPAAHHDIYFGLDAEAVAQADSTTAGIYQGRQNAASTTFDPGALEWNKTYYWRVDEVNESAIGSPWKGSLWSFSTADFLVVDDFEIYTDDEGNRLYQTWLDDYAAGGCGSTVGYFAAPFAEQTVVHSGRQSMPLDYNNVCAPHYSQTEQEFAPVQDWTVEDVNTFVLYVRGGVGNDVAPLSVSLQDSAGKLGTIRHPDAAIVQARQWTRWEIPLSEFTTAGVNVARIKKMYIAVGDKTQPAAGGCGMIFIDDIRVIR